MQHEEEQENELISNSTDLVVDTPTDNGVGAPMNNDEQQGIITIEDIGKVEYSVHSPLGNVSTTTKDGQLRNLSYQSATLSGDLGSISVSTNVERTDDSNNTYQIDGTYNIETSNGFNGTLQLHKDNSDQSISFSGNKAFNPNNINNTNDTYKVRKEELLSSDSQVSFEQKVGYNNDSGLYSNTSLMYKVKDNVFNSTFNASENGNSVTLGADLQKVKVDYSHTRTTEEDVKTITDNVTANLKTKNNQYNFNLANVNTTTNNESKTQSTDNSLVIGGSASLNRNEYGEFQSGLSGMASSSISISNGKVNGYSIEANGAFNHYGNEHDSTTDYLLSSTCSFAKQDNQTTVGADISSAIRINNCRTIFEPSLQYQMSNSDDTKQQSIVSKVGIYQQVGKQFGQASVFTVVRGGKEFMTTPDMKSSSWIGSITMGGDYRIAKNITITGRSTYDSKDKWSGEIGGRISF